MPYLELKFLEGLKYLHFLFFPVIFPDIEGYVSESYEIFLPNSSFLHNCSPFIILLGFCIVLYSIVAFLSYKGCISNKTLRHGAKRIKKYRLRYTLWNDFVWLTYLYAVFMALFQFKQAKFTTNWDIFNIVFAGVVFVMYLIYTVFIIYIAKKYKNLSDKIPKRWSFLRMEPSSFPMEIPLRYVRKLLVCLALIIPHVDSQCVILIVVNVLFLLYTGCFMPSKSKLTNAINITIDTSYIILAGMFYGYHRLENKNLDEQTGFGIALITIHAIVLLIMFIWLVYRFFMMISETECWKSIYAKATENRDPVYLKEQQRKRDL